MLLRGKVRIGRATGISPRDFGKENLVRVISCHITIKLDEVTDFCAIAWSFCQMDNLIGTEGEGRGTMEGRE